MVATRSFQALLVLAAACAMQAAPQQRDFLRKVSVREVEADLQATLSGLLSGSSATAAKLSSIEASTWQTFQALPKNSFGRLAPRAVRYIVHDYFAQEHGWLIKGLEPHGMQLKTSEVHEVSVLQDKAPLLVENLLEARQADRGLAFNDVVTMVAVLEQMMFDESVTLLQAAYRLNSLSLDEQIDEETLHKVLQSYLILFGQGSRANLFDVEHHQALIGARKRPDIEEFEHDTVLNFKYAHRHQMNPFRSHQYSFQATAEIMEDLAQQYGKWQNSECRDMKSHLAELDPEGLGRIPLGLFYAQPQGATYHFSESADYLRQIGALDETSPSNPQVRIANYVAGPSNCIASSSYYSVCCLSECSEILVDLERHVAAPTASPDTLLELLGKTSHTVFPQRLQDKLRTIASQHDGQVPLHGRLFAQWLHFAFPQECPFPSVLESATALTASQWLDSNTTASAEERMQHVTATSAVAAPSAEDHDIEERWSDHEVLPVSEPAQSSAQVGMSIMRVAVQLLAVVVGLRSALAAWRSTSSMHDKASKKDSKKDDDFFSLRV